MEDVAFLGSFLVYALIGAALCGVAGFLLLDRVEKGAIGACLGALLGPIGLVICWVIRDNAIRDEQERQDRHRPLNPAPQPRTHEYASKTAAMADVDALDKLARLKEAGHITEDEFALKKRQILQGVPPATPPTGVRRLKQPAGDFGRWLRTISDRKLSNLERDKTLTAAQAELVEDEIMRRSAHAMSDRDLEELSKDSALSAEHREVVASEIARRSAARALKNSLGQAGPDWRR